MPRIDHRPGTGIRISPHLDTMLVKWYRNLTLAIRNGADADQLKEARYWWVFYHSLCQRPPWNYTQQRVDDLTIGLVAENLSDLLSKDDNEELQS